MRLTIQGHSLLRPREVGLSTTDPASGDRRRTDTFPSFYFRCSVVLRTGLINASRTLQQLGAKHRQGDTGGKVRVMHGNGWTVAIRVADPATERCTSVNPL